MAASSGGKLVFVEENMEKMQYLRILKENLKKSAEDLRLGSGIARILCKRRLSRPN